MGKPGISIHIPDHPDLAIQRIVIDYNGTLSQGGRLTSGVAERLRRLHEIVAIDVITSDTFGTAAAELALTGLQPVLLDPSANLPLA